MRFVTTRHPEARDGGASLKAAMLAGLAPDGGLYVPETIDPWSRGELERLGTRTLTEIAYRALRPYTRPELDATICNGGLDLHRVALARVGQALQRGLVFIA